MDWASELLSLGQSSLLSSSPFCIPSRLYCDLDRVESSYPGGVATYLSNARSLLSESARGGDTFTSYIVSQPPVVRINSNDIITMEREVIKSKVLCRIGMVLVAGGLGERLGYPDIKLGLYTQTICPMTYAQYYCRSILSLQDCNGGIDVPLFIMTSGDTHENTIKLFNDNKYFGLKEKQVTIKQQEKVPALNDNNGSMVIDPSTGGLLTKPHGHGDIHILLHQTGTIKKWQEEFGCEYILFFQDTNALAMRAIAPMLYTSAKEDWVMNSLCIPRIPKEPVGAVCRLTPKTQGKDTVTNIEYNQLESLLKDIGGDVPNPEGISPYPGNCNILMLRTKEYSEILEKCKGVVSEFVNPKYTDATKTTFKAPTRVECMMQDIAKLLTLPEMKHGCAMMDRWMCFSTVKNNVADAATKLKTGGTAECAYSAECDLYRNNAGVMALAAKDSGVQCQVDNTEVEKTYAGVTLSRPPICFIDPRHGIMISQISDLLKKCKKPDCKTDHGKLEINQNGVFIINDAHCCEYIPCEDPFTPVQDGTDNEKVRGYKSNLKL